MSRHRSAYSGIRPASISKETASNNLKYISYCEECQRYFDIRSGCENDIRADEREQTVSWIESQWEIEAGEGTHSTELGRTVAQVLRRVAEDIRNGKHCDPNSFNRTKPCEDDLE